jgi:hypothetical protein
MSYDYDEIRNNPRAALYAAMDVLEMCDYDYERDDRVRVAFEDACYSLSKAIAYMNAETTTTEQTKEN